MLKRLDSPYVPGRPVGPWWKLKVQPFTIDAILIAAQPGRGRRAGLLTDYTFAVADATGKLVTICKAYSGLTDEELVEVDRYVRRVSKERFGPVYSVPPERVYEIGFEAIRPLTATNPASRCASPHPAPAHRQNRCPGRHGRIGPQNAPRLRGE